MSGHHNTSSLPDAAQLSALLQALTQPDTNTIRQAEATLKPVLKNADSMNTLWRLIADPTQPLAIRHVGAVVLRKRLPTHYSSWDVSVQQQWQNDLLQTLATEPSRPVRSGLLGVVAAVAHLEAAPFPALLQFLAAAANSEQASARELCFLLLSEMTETVGTHWKAQAADLTQLYAVTLTTPTQDAAVVKACATSLGALMSFWADDEEQHLLQGLAPLLPTLLQVAAAAAAASTSTSSSAHSNDEDFVAAVLDVLYDLCYSPSPSLAAYLNATIDFCLHILRNRQLELRVRDAAALVIATTAESKPKTLARSSELLGAVLDTLFWMMQESSESAAGALFESNPAWRADLEEEHNMHGGGDDHDHDGDLDAPTETSMAQGTLDMLSCELPKKYIWPACWHRCQALMNSPGPAARKAGVAGLGVVAEGCAEPLTVALAEVLPHVFRMASDAAAAPVRECACFCLGQMSEHCQPDILQYADAILPIVFALLDDGNVAVQATSCYVLEMFCERLEPEAVRPLLDSLVRKLAAMLEATTKRSVQEMAVAALAATAVAAEGEFAPYVPGVAALMLKLMQLTDAALYSLRGRALECMGHMAIAVGRDVFRPYFVATMQCAMEGLSTDSTDLQEFAFAVFANLSKVMKEEFAPALPDLVPHLLQAIEMDEGQLQEADDNDGQAFTGLDDSDDEDENGNYVLHVRTALLEVKKGALTALGEMAAHTGTSFCPYLEPSMQALQKAATNWHPIVKGEAAEAFPSMIVPSIAAYHNGEIEWRKGDVNGENPLSAHTTAIVMAVLKEEMALLLDDDKNTVGKACEAIQGVVELCGPHVLVPIVNDLFTHTLNILTKQAPCQLVDGVYDGELPDDDDDHDTLMQAACDLVGAFCRVLGPHFVPYLQQFLPVICQYGASSRPASDRSMAIGCLSEVAQELEGNIYGYWDSVFRPGILAGLADEDENVKRNAAFCTAMCCEHLRDRIAGDYPAILNELGALFRLDTASGDAATTACVDNAAACVARMIMACPSQVPMSHVLPVFLRALPLKTDMTENETVYKCLLGLLDMRNADFMANAQEVRRIFTEASSDDSEVDDEWKAKLKQALQNF